MKKTIMILLLLFSLNFIIYSNKINFKDEFIKANDFYNNKNFKSALEKYSFLNKNGCDNFNVNYNIGCCYYNLGELGKSKFYFERALFYKPFDRDLKNNLTIVYNKLQILSGGEQNIMAKRIIFFIPTFFLIILLIILLIAVIIFALLTFFSAKNKKIFFIILIITFIFMIIANLFFFSQFFDYNKNIFVSTSKLSNVFVTPNDNETILLTIQEGTSGTVVDEIDHYIKINLPNQTTGWIKKEDVIFKI